MIPDGVREWIIEAASGPASIYEHYGVRTVNESRARAVLDWIASQTEESQPVAPQPDWSTAPEWAMWWAVDPDMVGYWFGTEPLAGYGEWNSYDDQNSKVKAGYYSMPLGIDWRQTLRKRPEAE